jgi:CheY-like chemotaxis protein
MANILIVDDVAANRTFLVTLLRYHGHQMLEAGNGREGLAAVHAGRPDMVITDVLMPVMDGFEFLKQLRLDPATSGIPVVFSTAHYGEREARALALSGGVSDVLTKPTESAEVLKVVARVLSGEAPSGIAEDAAPLSPEFDREHLRLLTDKLSEKSDDLKTSNARLRALINIGLELASQRNSDRLLQSVCVAARDLFAASYVTLGIVDRNDRTMQRVVTYGVDTPQWLRTGQAVPGTLGAVVTERRTLRGGPNGNGATGIVPRSTPRSRPTWPHPSRHRPTSMAGSASSATRAAPSPRMMSTWSGRSRARSDASTRTAISMPSRNGGPKNCSTR